jgi:hypothetical protein
MKDELNKMKGTFSIPIGGDYSRICTERERVHQYGLFAKAEM